MRIALCRCTFDAQGTTHAAVVVYNVPQPVFTVVGGFLFPMIEDLHRAYPGASELRNFGESLLVSIEATIEEWRALSNAQKVALVYRTLDEHEVRS